MTAAHYLQRFTENRDADPDEAKMFWSGGPVEVADRTWFQALFSGVTAFETDAGLVLVDTGTEMFAPALAEMLRRETSAPVHTAIYTHGHVDHAYGLDKFLMPGQEPPRVVAQQAMLDRFARYDRTAGHNTAINTRQFGGTVPPSREPGIFHAPSIMPDTLYDDFLELEVGGVRFELQHSRGETDDHTWVFCPDRAVLCPGDLFIWAVPNAGNPQKVQRYPWDWAAALRDMAELAPRSLCPGHGGPVVDDAAKVHRMLTETAEYLESIVEQALACLEDGSPPHTDIVRSVEIPKTGAAWLQPLYDDPEFIVRNVIRFFGGWWTGRPSELKPAPRDATAREIAALAGGPDKLAARATELLATGDLALAGHIADYALEAAPDSPAVQDAVATVYEARAEAEPSLMASNIFSSAAAYARAGRAFA